MESNSIASLARVFGSLGTAGITITLTVTSETAHLMTMWLLSGAIICLLGITFHERLCSSSFGRELDSLSEDEQIAKMFRYLDNKDAQRSSHPIGS